MARRRVLDAWQRECRRYSAQYLCERLETNPDFLAGLQQLRRGVSNLVSARREQVLAAAQDAAGDSDFTALLLSQERTAMRTALMQPEQELVDQVVVHLTRRVLQDVVPPPADWLGGDDAQSAPGTAATGPATVASTETAATERSGHIDHDTDLSVFADQLETTQDEEEEIGRCSQGDSARTSSQPRLSQPVSSQATPLLTNDVRRVVATFPAGRLVDLYTGDILQDEVASGLHDPTIGMKWNPRCMMLRRQVLVASCSHTLRLFRVVTLPQGCARIASRGFTWQGHGSAVTDCAVLAHDIFASAGLDCIVAVWRIINTKSPPTLVHVFKEHTGPVMRLAALPDGNLASCSQDGSALVYCLAGAQTRLLGSAKPTPGIEDPTLLGLVAVPNNGLVLASATGALHRVSILAADTAAASWPVQVLGVPPCQSGRMISIPERNALLYLSGTGPSLRLLHCSLDTQDVVEVVASLRVEDTFLAAFHWISQTEVLLTTDPTWWRIDVAASVPSARRCCDMPKSSASLVL